MRYRSDRGGLKDQGILDSKMLEEDHGENSVTSDRKDFRVPTTRCCTQRRNQLFLCTNEISYSRLATKSNSSYQPSLESDGAVLTQAKLPADHIEHSHSNLHSLEAQVLIADTNLHHNFTLVTSESRMQNPRRHLLLTQPCPIFSCPSAGLQPSLCLSVRQWHHLAIYIVDIMSRGLNCSSNRARATPCT